MIFSNIDFRVKYVDPSATENSDGSTPQPPKGSISNHFLVAGEDLEG